MRNRKPKHPTVPFHYINRRAVCAETEKVLAHNAICLENTGECFYLAIDTECLDILTAKGQPAMLDFPTRFKRPPVKFV